MIMCLDSVIHHFLSDVRSAQIFHHCGGPPIIISIFNNHTHNSHLLNACFSVIAASATANEILKESFITLKVDELILNTLKAGNHASIPSLYDAIRILVTPDDFRVAASQVRLSFHAHLSFYFLPPFPIAMLE